MRNRKSKIETRKSAFTLVELLVVVGIISLLIALAAGAYTSVIDSGKGRATRALLSRATGIATEYEVTTGLVISHYDGAANADPYNLGNMAEFDYTGIDQNYTSERPGYDPENPGSRDLDDNANENDFKEFSIERFVWSTYQIPSARDMYGRVGGSGITDQDGNNFMEMRDAWGKKIVYAAFTDDASFGPDNFLPAHDRPFFASAGPDGVFGTDDDIYSFDLPSE